MIMAPAPLLLIAIKTALKKNKGVATPFQFLTQRL
jgi:hypothetical protein